jgi:hypothetical protein
MPTNDEAGWAYHEDGEEPGALENTAADQTQNSQADVSWTASEFIAQHKDFKWFIAFYIAIGLIAVAVFFATKDIISSIVIVIAAILFAAIANRKPRQLPYVVSSQGVTVGERFYSYNSFKSFALAREGAIGSINFMPLQRFQPELTIYFPPDQEEPIINLLAEHLPNDQKASERIIDKLARQIHL